MSYSKPLAIAGGTKGDGTYEVNVFKTIDVEEIRLDPRNYRQARHAQKLVGGGYKDAPVLWLEDTQEPYPERSIRFYQSPAGRIPKPAKICGIAVEKEKPFFVSGVVPMKDALEVRRVANEKGLLTHSYLSVESELNSPWGRMRYRFDPTVCVDWYDTKGSEFVLQWPVVKIAQVYENGEWRNTPTLLVEGNEGLVTTHTLLFNGDRAWFTSEKHPAATALAFKQYLEKLGVRTAHV